MMKKLSLTEKNELKCIKNEEQVLKKKLECSSLKSHSGADNGEEGNGRDGGEGDEEVESPGGTMSHPH